MVSLYSVTHVHTKRSAFRWSLRDVASGGLLDPCAVIVWALAGGEEAEDLDEAITGDIESLFAWTLSTIREADEALLLAAIAEILNDATLSPREVLARMEEPHFNLWREVTASINEDTVCAARDLIFFQWLLHEALPGRFAPPFLAQVSIYGFDIHPDARPFEVKDGSMAVRALTDQGPDHPLRAVVKAFGDEVDWMMDIIFRVDHIGGSDDIYALWLPAHLTGDLPENTTWESTAFHFT